MKISIRKVPVSKAAELAIKNRLFVNGWRLRYILHDIIRFPDWRSDFKACMAFVGDTPVGICLRINYKSNNQLMVFVKKLYRHNGIGKKLVCRLKDENSYGERGIRRSNGKIWKLNNIKYK